MSQLALFDSLPTSPVRPRRKSAAPEQAKPVDASEEARSYWKVGMLAYLGVTSTIQGEQWVQYTIGCSGRVEVIEGDLAGVRIETPGHKFDSRLAVKRLAHLGRPQ